MIVNNLSEYGGTKQLIDTLSATGIKELNPPQILAVKAGLLRDNDSFVIAAPTASGKTLIAEMAALKYIFERGGKVIYLVPLRALAREKYDDFTKKYKGMGIKVMQSTGDYDSADPWIRDADFIISTNEKMDSLIRHRAPWLKDISLVVADEVHLIGDSHRGPTLEVVLTRLKWMNPNLRFIALSATIPNAEDIACWLNARLIASDWRPVPLREGVYFNDTVMFNDGIRKWILEESRVDVVNLAVETIKDKGQALIFVNTRKATEAAAHKASKFISKILSEKEKESLKTVSETVIKASSEPTKVCQKLAEYVKDGVAFHHAGIYSSHRKIIEDAFRENQIKLLVSTTTLAMGLNLPSRRVIIRDWWRYESGKGMYPIPVIEIKQMSGRAGRPGFDEYGEAVLVARNERDESNLFEKYINGKPENIDSRLANKSALRTHILASIAGMFTKSKAELLDFMGKTFFAFQKGIEYLSPIIDEILNFLITEGMTTIDIKGLRATRFGRRVSDLYIDPLTGVIIRNALYQPQEKKVFSILHMIASTPDMISLTIKKKDYQDMVDIFSANSEDLLIPEEDNYLSDEILSDIKVASVLMQWIEETHEDEIVSRFGIGPGDLRTMVELSDWLLYSSAEIGRVFGLKDAEKPIASLRARISYGIKEELLQLVTLKGIGRIRARNLYDSGYKTLKDIKDADVEALTKVPAVGRAIAEDIKKQVSYPSMSSIVR